MGKEPHDVKNNTHTLTLTLTAPGYTTVNTQVTGGVSGKVVALPALTFGDLSGGSSSVTSSSVLQAIQCLASATNCGDSLTPLLPLAFSDIVRLIRHMREHSVCTPFSLSLCTFSLETSAAHGRS